MTKKPYFLSMRNLFILSLLICSCKKEPERYKYRVIQSFYYDDNCGATASGSTENDAYLTLEEAQLRNYDYTALEYKDVVCAGTYEVHYKSVAILQGKYY